MEYYQPLFVTLFLCLLTASIYAQDTPVRLTVKSEPSDQCYSSDVFARIDDEVRSLFASGVGTFENPASSCASLPQDYPSGQYWIRPSNMSAPTLQYCDMVSRVCSCSATGGWMRVANLNMTDPNQSCPSGFRLVPSPRRTCGRPSAGCVSTTFPVSGVQYSRVCGRVVGYQYGSPNAFNPYFDTSSTIDGLYVEGVSLTHGSSPRMHIWTLATALDEVHGNEWVCPCSNTNLTFTGRVPPFIGQDYFCETGSRDEYELGRFYLEDPLWDGQGCGAVSTCCRHPQYFCKQLPQPTTDNIELRLCSSGAPISDEDTLLEYVEIHIK